MEIRTHEAIDRRWSGRPLALAPGRATVELATIPGMAADASGLVHGGFVFSLADHAAMLAVNEPTVVLGSATTRFLRPVRAGERLVAEAVVESAEGRKRVVTCTVRRGEEPVLESQLVAFVPERHVLAGEEGR